MRDIKKEMMKVKASKFQEWYNSLTEEEIKQGKPSLAKFLK